MTEIAHMYINAAVTEWKLTHSWSYYNVFLLIITVLSVGNFEGVGNEKQCNIVNIVV